MAANVTLVQFAEDVTTTTSIVTQTIGSIADLFMNHPLLILAVGLCVVGIGLRFVKGILHQISHE